MERARGIGRLFFVYGLVITLFFAGTALGNRAVAVFSESAPVIRHHTVVIDAGHGGEDGGAFSCTGRSESMYNLSLALRTDQLLGLLGYRTKMIRTTDTAVYTQGNSIAQKKVSDLRERVRITNSYQNGLLLSIHQNTFPQSVYHGAQVFYANTPGSELLARSMQSALISSLDPSSRRMVKKGEGIYLLEKAEICAVLVECGFISNPQEEALLNTPEYQKKLAGIMAATVAEYLSLS